MHETSSGSSADLTNLIEGKDYNLSVQTLAKRSEILSDIESNKSQSVSTRPYSNASAPNNLNAEVMDKALEMTS